MKILLPIDGSAHALAAERHALTLRAQGLTTEMVLINVQEPASLYEVVLAHDRAVLDEVRRSAGAELLAPAEALLDTAGVTWESEVVGGQPAAMLAELLENYGCEAVVMGRRGVGAPDAGGLGSVAQALAAHAAVPVTLVGLMDEPAEAADDESEAES